MRFYNTQHAYYCGVDLHARSMFTHILDHEGKTVFERDLPAGPDAFLDAVKPFRQGLVVGCECMFAWYWLADLCEDTSVPFVLGHALYMKAIHGGKAKNDRIDAGKIAGLLARRHVSRWPTSIPRAKRETRDLLRRRCFFVSQRSQLIAHIVNTNSQYNLPPLDEEAVLRRQSLRRHGRRVSPHASTQQSILADLQLDRRLRRADRRGGTHRAQDGQDRRSGDTAAACAPFRASARSWAWSCSTRSTR